MFERKQEVGIRKVPVFTVHMLPRPYELIKTVEAKDIVFHSGGKGDILTKLAEAGGEIPGCDAVIRHIHPKWISQWRSIRIWNCGKIRLSRGLVHA